MHLTLIEINWNMYVFGDKSHFVSSYLHAFAYNSDRCTIEKTAFALYVLSVHLCNNRSLSGAHSSLSFSMISGISSTSNSITFKTMTTYRERAQLSATHALDFVSGVADTALIRPLVSQESLGLNAGTSTSCVSAAGGAVGVAH